jgi:hypothetical protein
MDYASTDWSCWCFGLACWTPPVYYAVGAVGESHVCPEVVAYRWVGVVLGALRSSDTHFQRGFPVFLPEKHIRVTVATILDGSVIP